jgi:large subunit ribosomal protein L14
MLLKIIDNSGATLARVIKILSKKKSLKVGGLVVTSIQKNIPNSKIRKGQLFKAVVVTGDSKNLALSCKTPKSIVLVKKAPKGNDLLPIANRIKKPVSSHLRNIRGMNKILSLSKRNI